jgi:DNA sulfur modification protein DndD
VRDHLDFTAVELENIFAYRGLSKIDLSGCTEDRNVIVVSGRNGAGKTSLLNALKLLFLGSASLVMRRVGFGGTDLSPKNYVIGQPGRWYGVFNSAAQEPDARARVALEWVSGAQRFKIQRIFTRVNSSLGFKEELIVTAGERRLSDGEALAFVAALAPSEIVPFYFFDGEQVQSFADAEEGRERVEIERLLGLSFVPELTKELDAFARAKRRAGLPAEVRMAVVTAENDLRAAQAHSEALNRSRVEEEEQVVELQRRRNRLDDERNSLRTGMSNGARRLMLNRIEMLGSQRERLAIELAEQLPSEAPWLTNLPLVRQAFAALDEHMANSGDSSLAGKLHRELPPALKQALGGLAPPVHLDDGQYRTFVDGVHALLVAQGVSTQTYSNPLFESLSPRQIRMLRDRYLAWSDKGESLAGSQADKLRLIRQVTNERIQTQRDLDEAELTTDEGRHQFDMLTEQIQGLDVSIRERMDKVTELRVEEQRAEREAEGARDRIRQSEERFDSVTRENRAYQLSFQIKRALETYLDKRRQQIRSSVERRLNERIGILLGPTQLIKTVTLDDRFVMRYFDDGGAEVARRSISAGMRQLVAMAMLWALKDEAGRDLPVMIDTPLGRIDQENRALLMSEYFPKAGKPLVLLPTNSELGREALGQLGNRIRRRYEIRNADGLQARIVEDDAFRFGGEQAL